MQAIQLIEICIAAMGGAAVGVAVQRWQARQRIGLLEQRLARAEEGRTQALERSNVAREQIAQLNKAIADLRRAHQPARAAARPPQPTAEERREMAERALAAASDGDEDKRHSGKVIAFANTEPMQF